MRSSKMCWAYAIISPFVSTGELMNTSLIQFTVMNKCPVSIAQSRMFHLGSLDPINVCSMFCMAFSMRRQQSARCTVACCKCTAGALVSMLWPPGDFFMWCKDLHYKLKTCSQVSNWKFYLYWKHIQSLMQKRRNSSALATELHLFCIKLLILLSWVMVNGVMISFTGCMVWWCSPLSVLFPAISKLVEISLTRHCISCLCLFIKCCFSHSKGKVVNVMGPWTRWESLCHESIFLTHWSWDKMVDIL